LLPFFHKVLLLQGFFIGGEGGITRRFAPRPRYVLSPRAQTDLGDIWDYSADRWGLDQAETYTRDLWQRIEAVAARPAMGQECSDIRAQDMRWTVL
jgi:plasmid stabilization system protein ParE